MIWFKAMSFHDVEIVSVKENDFGIHLWYMGKDKATNLLKKTDLTKKSGIL